MTFFFILCVSETIHFETIMVCFKSRYFIRGQTISQNFTKHVVYNFIIIKLTRPPKFASSLYDNSLSWANFQGVENEACHRLTLFACSVKLCVSKCIHFEMKMLTNYLFKVASWMFAQRTNKVVRKFFSDIFISTDSAFPNGLSLRRFADFLWFRFDVGKIICVCC